MRLVLLSLSESRIKLIPGLHRFFVLCFRNCGIASGICIIIAQFPANFIAHIEIEIQSLNAIFPEIVAHVYTAVQALLIAG